MRNYLTVDGVNLSTFGVYITGAGTFLSPAKEFSKYEIPAKNGTDISLITRLENVEITYPCFIYTNFETNLRNLRSFLLSRKGYVRISDTYHADEFRLGFFEGPIEPKVQPKLDCGSFDLIFNCKPQRWLTSGETATTRTGTTAYTFTNPTRFDAKPLVRLNGYGKLRVASVDITMQSGTGYSYVDIDCETMNVYNGNDNLSRYVSFQEANATIWGVDAPIFTASTTSVVQALTSSVTSWTVTPRWWEV